MFIIQHAASCTRYQDATTAWERHLLDKNFKLNPIHALEIYQIPWSPWIHWIHWKFFSVYKKLYRTVYARWDRLNPRNRTTEFPFFRGVLVLLTFGQFSPERTQTKHKLHKIWRSLKFCKNLGKLAHARVFRLLQSHLAWVNLISTKVIYSSWVEHVPRILNEEEPRLLNNLVTLMSHLKLTICNQTGTFSKIQSHWIFPKLIMSFRKWRLLESVFLVKGMHPKTFVNP